MGYRGAAFTRRKHRFRAVLLPFFRGIVWDIPLLGNRSRNPLLHLDAPPELGWWLATLPVQIVEALILRHDNGSKPADASILEIASMCIVNGFLVAIACWVLGLWLNRSDAGFIRNLIRSFWHVERRVFWRRVPILSGWGAALGGALTLAGIGLAYLLGRGSDSGAFLVWWALYLPLHAVCVAIGKDWPDFSHGPTVANVVAASLINGVLLAAIVASLPLSARFLLADPRVASS